MAEKDLASIPSAYEKALREAIAQGSFVPPGAPFQGPVQAPVQLGPGNPYAPLSASGAADLGQGLSVSGQGARYGPGQYDWGAMLNYLYRR